MTLYYYSAMTRCSRTYTLNSLTSRTSPVEQNWKLTQAMKGASKSDAFEIVGGNSDEDLELEAEGPGDEDAMYDF